MLPAHVVLPAPLLTSMALPVLLVTVPPAPGVAPPLLPNEPMYWLVPFKSSMAP